ncbi:cysteine protease [Dimargaris verticillata]|uniref:Cysteine protease n=1 Tax=Dimargaris verticillata TaxID=2761393 RepID=A0A9W8EDE4_9FUNG|nr:cysteine protease [Dimargaris verticillata]
MAQNDSLTNWKQLLLEAERIARQGAAAEAQDDSTTAVELYREAAGLQISAYAEADRSAKKSIKRLFDQTVEKATALKASLDLATPPNNSGATKSNAAILSNPVQSAMTKAAPLIPSAAKPSKGKPLPTLRSPTFGLSSAEMDVLRTTSYVNDMIFLPWCDDDGEEPYFFAEPFIDKDGLPALSSKQQERLAGWKRPQEFMSHPQMVCQVSCTSIIQDVVTDCSFVASLCVAAAYENRFNKRLITSCIYPQNQQGQPIYNPSGKYAVRLMCNGIARKVVVDDRFPLARDGKLLCSYTRNRAELWPMIVEKAYMKLMGGYDFPGSNSSIDLYTLTGWLPEQVFIQDAKFNPTTLWDRVYQGLHYGDTLVTMATGDMSADLAASLGLVASHAYAVLDAVVMDGGLCLLQLKNPWSVKRWKGPYSCLDSKRWTPELCSKLRYDPKHAQTVDDGIFWIDYASLCQYFGSVHLNWNPGLLPHCCLTHALWPQHQGPTSAVYNLGANPQYSLRIDHTTGRASDTAPVWLLLSKHITRKEENRDYISMYVYDRPNATSRVHSPEDPLVATDFINSPHVLVRFNAPPGVSYVSLVLLQYEKVRDLHFTLRAHSMAPLTLAPIPQLPHRQQLAGEWDDQTCGGSAVHASFGDNPQYKLTIPAGASNDQGLPVTGMAMLEAGTDKQVNLVVVRGGLRVASLSYRNTVSDSGPYSESTCFCPLSADLSPGEYTVIASTHQPGQRGAFKLSVELGQPFTLAAIPPEGAGMYRRVVRGAWVRGVNAMGNPSDHADDYMRNPSYLLTLHEPTEITLRLQAPHIDPSPALNVTLFARDLTRSPRHREAATSGSYVNAVQGVAIPRTRLVPISAMGATQYLAVFSTWERGVEGAYQAVVFSDKKIEIEPWSASSPCYP